MLCSGRVCAGAGRFFRLRAILFRRSLLPAAGFRHGRTGSGPVYYTMCRGGLWGLMREDFTVVLECRAPQPVTRAIWGTGHGAATE